MLNTFYPSKILLFGEYTVINGGDALAIPFNEFGGQWRMGGTLEEQMRLREWCAYLKERFRDFDSKKMQSALAQGMYFDSNIPTGYGLGSSGAVCAAVYDTFFLNKEENKERLKAVFAEMEGFFHGKSSGLDPLVCYLQKGILIGGKGRVQTIELPTLSKGNKQFFLLDTGMPRKTGPLVAYYLSKLEGEAFAQKIAQELLPANNSIIEKLMISDFKEVEACFQIISEFQLAYFEKMIPEGFHSIWRKGMLTDDYYLKLCGAGGGGFLLGFSSKKIDFEKIFSPYRILKI